MFYNGKEYNTGNLINAEYREGTSFARLHIPIEKVTTILPNQSINITSGSCLGFIMKNDPSALPPSSMSINAYTTEGKAIKVLIP